MRSISGCWLAQNSTSRQEKSIPEPSWLALLEHKPCSFSCFLYVPILSCPCFVTVLCHLVKFHCYHLTFLRLPLPRCVGLDSRLGLTAAGCVL